MKQAAFEWDAANLEHITQHDVGPEEAEAVLDNDPLILRTGGQRYLAYGQSDEGRYLLVVFVHRLASRVRVITARVDRW